MTKINPDQERILDAAEKRMIKFGYHKVTMDEIAEDLRMSKNTIYKSFTSKEEIAKGLVKRLELRVNQGLDNIEKTQKDSLKVFSESILFLRKKLGPWFEHFFREIPTEAPAIWDEFLRYRNEKILGVRTVVEAGIKKGVFRKVNPAVAVQAYLGLVKAIVNSKFLDEEKLGFHEALELALDIWSHGMLKKGKER